MITLPLGELFCVVLGLKFSICNDRFLILSSCNSICLASFSARFSSDALALVLLRKIPWVNTYELKLLKSVLIAESLISKRANEVLSVIADTIELSAETFLSDSSIAESLDT